MILQLLVDGTNRANREINPGRPPRAAYVECSAVAGTDVYHAGAAGCALTDCAAFWRRATLVAGNCLAASLVSNRRHCRDGPALLSSQLGQHRARTVGVRRDHRRR